MSYNMLENIPIYVVIVAGYVRRVNVGRIIQVKQSPALQNVVLCLCVVALFSFVALLCGVVMYQSDTMTMQYCCKRLMYHRDTIGRGRILEFENGKQTPPRRKIPFVHLWRDPSPDIYNPKPTTTWSKN